MFQSPVRQVGLDRKTVNPFSILPRSGAAWNPYTFRAASTIFSPKADLQKATQFRSLPGFGIAGNVAFKLSRAFVRGMPRRSSCHPHISLNPEASCIVESTDFDGDHRRIAIRPQENLNAALAAKKVPPLVGFTLKTDGSPSVSMKPASLNTRVTLADPPTIYWQSRQWHATPPSGSPSTRNLILPHRQPPVCMDTSVRRTT